MESLVSVIPLYDMSCGPCNQPDTLWCVTMTEHLFTFNGYILVLTFSPLCRRIDRTVQLLLLEQVPDRYFSDRVFSESHPHKSLYLPRLEIDLVLDTSMSRAIGSLNSRAQLPHVACRPKSVSVLGSLLPPRRYNLSTIVGRQRLYRDLDRLGCANIAAVHVSDSMEKHAGTCDLHAG